MPERAAEQALACGPHGFVAAVQRWWQGGETPASLQSEAFSPAPVDAGEQTCVRLAFRRSGVACQGDTAHNLLEQAEAQGLRPMHGCRQGICTRCTCQLLSGRVRDLYHPQQGYFLELWSDSVVATVTRESAEVLGLAVGKPALAVFKASTVILAVAA